MMMLHILSFYLRTILVFCTEIKALNDTIHLPFHEAVTISNSSTVHCGTTGTGSPMLIMRDTYLKCITITSKYEKNSSESEFLEIFYSRIGQLFIGWTLIFKGVAGVPGIMSSIWQNEFTFKEGSMEALSEENNFKYHYKNRIVKEWATFNPAQVEFNFIYLNDRVQ